MHDVRPSFVLFAVIWKNYFGKKMDFRAIIFYNFRRGLSRQVCIEELKSWFGNKATSFSTVKNWFNEFKRGRTSLKDEVCEVTPKTAVVPENIDVVPELIK